ncbi:MAG: sulfatase-like hydrolase/transferase [Bacteroidetes bacterium]|nr:sulfatase-like hydrolase/transferase [Bacteroidota bacterium]
MVAPGYTGLYTNSPQAFIYSFRSGWTYVKPLHYFSDEEADQLVPVFYANNPNVTPNKRNIVLFILESFSYSYLDINNPNKPSTPFFDSLIQHSTFFTNAYANNTTSANGLCSILSGIPSLINQPFFSSAYAGNPINAIALALNKNAYETSFFLGANDDHFGFKKGLNF